MSLIFSNLVAVNQLSLNHRMYNLYTKFVKILEICKQFSQNLVNECGNIPRRGPVPKFSYLEVVALSLTAEAESIDSEKWLFDYRLQDTKASSPISYQEGSSMTAVRKQQAYAKRYAKGLPWKWTGKKNSSLSTPSQ